VRTPEQWQAVEALDATRKELARWVAYYRDGVGIMPQRGQAVDIIGQGLIVSGRLRRYEVVEGLALPKDVVIADHPLARVAEELVDGRRFLLSHPHAAYRPALLLVERPKDE